MGNKIRLYIDYRGKLRVTAYGDLSDIYVVAGFKMKAGKEKNYLFPILKIEIPKK